jgi:hypothetical protein
MHSYSHEVRCITSGFSLDCSRASRLFLSVSNVSKLWVHRLMHRLTSAATIETHSRARVKHFEPSSCSARHARTIARTRNALCDTDNCARCVTTTWKRAVKKFRRARSNPRAFATRPPRRRSVQRGVTSVASHASHASRRRTRVAAHRCRHGRRRTTTRHRGTTCSVADTRTRAINRPCGRRALEAATTGPGRKTSPGLVPDSFSTTVAAPSRFELPLPP